MWIGSDLRKNGFSLEEDPHAPPGHHFKLKAVPFSKNITFGVEGMMYPLFPNIACCYLERNKHSLSSEMSVFILDVPYSA